MKKHIILGLLVFIFWTGVEPATALSDESSTSTAKIEGEGLDRLSDLPMRLNPQLGLSSFEKSGAGGNNGQEQFMGGLTVEFGESVRKLETGLLLMPVNAKINGQDVNSTYLAIPMLAKLRLANYGAQSWYAKFGFLTAFETSSNRDSETNNIDVLASVGAGGRLVMTKRSDFIIEATYNRGMLDSLRSGSSTTYNQGFLVMAGMSIGL